MQNASLLGGEESCTALRAGILYLASLITGQGFVGKNMGLLGIILTPLTARTMQAAYLSARNGLI